MKLRVYDLKINGRVFDETNEFRQLRMYIPIESEQYKLIEWMQEFSLQPATRENALLAYIRTWIFYQCELSYKMQFMFDMPCEAYSTDQPYAADMVDSLYEAYDRVFVTLRLPKRVIVDTADVEYQQSTDDIDDIELHVFQMLMHSLPIYIESIEKA